MSSLTPTTRLAALLVVVFAASGLGSCGLGELTPGLYEPVSAPGSPASAPALTTCRPGHTRCVGEGGYYERCGASGEIVGTGTCAWDEVCHADASSEEPACLPVELSCAPGQPVRLAPERVSFKDVQTLKSVRRTALLTNCGPLWMRIDAVEVIGRPAFSEGDGLVGEEGQVLAPGAVSPLRVLYHPSPYTSGEEGELRVRAVLLASPDAGSGTPMEVRVPLTGRARDSLLAPLVEIPPVDFGFVPVDRSTAREVHLRNSGGVPVRIDSVEVQVRGEEVGVLELAIPEELEIAPGAVFSLPARFAPEQVGEMEARYTLWAKPWPLDLPRPEVVLRGVGVAAPGACGETVPVAQLVMSDAQAPDTAADDWLEVEPWTRLRLDGHASFARAPGASVTGYAMTLIEAPVGSSARLVPAASAPEDAALREVGLDLVGDYLIGLDVSDSLGQTSCARRVVRARVATRSALHVELSWVTPGDPVRDDVGPGAGVDLDLLIEREAQPGDMPIPHEPWVLDPNVCSAANPEPDWGLLRYGADDCRTLRADSDGWGPELITVAQAEGRAYTVRVAARDAWGYGRSLASVNIYVDGELRFASPAQALVEGEVWTVARVQPTRGLIEEIHTIEPAP